MIDRKVLESILPKVEKPARYIGGEPNMVRKSADVPIRFLFAFPDVYEVGMSHLGTTILYHLTNEREDTYAERTYAPFKDMQDCMKEAGIPLYSLETYTPAAEFDIIGFNLSYEMCYTTVLAMLELAGLPKLASQRDGLPLVIAGGACTYNAEPLADFIDLFIIGEGEEVNMELLDLYKAHKEKGFEKKAFLEEAAQIPGVYVPSLYTITYCADGRVASIDGPQMPVRKRFVKDLDASYYPEKFMVPFLRPVHDRAVLEIFRGCTRGCRFCQAGFIYRPVRERKQETLFRQADCILKDTGYEEISLLSLSSGDYSTIEELSIGLIEKYEKDHVSVSLPSLRIDSFDKEYAKRMQGARKSSYTFAPEAGTQRLRDVINKNITEEDIMRGVRYAFESGASSIKLYFMIGLPTETYADLDGIVDLVKKIRGVFFSLPKEQRSGALSIHVSTSSFVPKPFTPFQWEKQDTMDELHAKQEYLREQLKMRGVRYNWHEAQLSYLEAVFARGDRRLGKVLLYAQENGAMFDSWQDYFQNEFWTDAFLRAGIDPEFYIYRERDVDEILPWDHIDCYVKKSYLVRELKRAREAVCTPDCREGCTGCGLGGRCFEK